MQSSTIMAKLDAAAQPAAFAGIYVKSVTIAAVRDWDHDPIMTIVWSMPDTSAALTTLAALPGITEQSVSRPSDTRISLPRAMASASEIEEAVLHAAWHLGAWDVTRIESAPLPPGADWRDLRYGIASEFGYGGYVINGQQLATGDSASEQVCMLAASQGRITWRFVPMRLATRIARSRWLGKDLSLNTEGGRPQAAPAFAMGTWRHPKEPFTAADMVYALSDGTAPAAPRQARGGKASYARRLARRAVDRQRRTGENM